MTEYTWTIVYLAETDLKWEFNPQNIKFYAEIDKRIWIFSENQTRK